MSERRPRASLPLRCAQVVLGLITAFCAVTLGAIVAGWVYIAPLALSTYLTPGFWIPAPLVVFFAISSFRLLGGRGSSAGEGLLSPAGYRVFGGMLLFFGFLVAAGVAPGEPEGALIVALVFLALATGCFAVAWQRGRAIRARIA